MMKRVVIAAWPPLLVVALHFGLLVVLARIDTVRELLGTANPSIPLALLLFTFYVLRLVAIFIVPGWLLARLLRLRQTA